MIIIYSAKKRLLTLAVCRRAWLGLLLASSLGACQRAGYQLQPAESAVHQEIMSEMAPESAVVTIAAPLAAQPSESHQQIRRHVPPPKGRPQMPKVPALRGLARSAATAHMAPSVPRQRQEPGPGGQPVRYRSRGVAIILAALSLTYIPLSLHNFYLGYYGRGAIAIALVVVGLYLVLLGLLGSLFSGTGLVGLGIVGLALLGGWFIWQIADLVRIISGDLKPKNGEYGPRLFQTRPDAKTTPPPHTD